MKNFKNMSEIVKAENQKKKNLRIYIAALLAVQMLMLPMSGCTVASGASSGDVHALDLLDVAVGLERPG